MPYAKRETRQEYAPVLTPLMQKMQDGHVTPGDLNYLITMLCNQYVYGHPIDYAHAVNDVIGVLECAKLEYYDQIAKPYERRKRKENDDVYWVRSLFRRKK